MEYWCMCDIGVGIVPDRMRTDRTDADQQSGDHIGSYSVRKCRFQKQCDDIERSF